MNHTSRFAMIPCALLAGAFALAGCRVEVTGPKRYDGTPKTTSAAWTTTKIVTIDNGNGSLTVDTAGTTSDVSVTGAPFALEPDDDQGKQTAVNEMTNKLVLAATADSTGNVTVSGNGTGTYGFDMTVHLPSNFDGPLSITEGNGPITVAGSAISPSTTITGSAGDITVQNIANSVVIKNGAGDITVSARPAGAGNSIRTDVGDINATIAGDVTITAKTEFGGTVTPPPGAAANLSADKMSAAITLGAGTGALDVSTGNGNVIFQ